MRSEIIKSEFLGNQVRFILQCRGLQPAARGPLAARPVIICGPRSHLKLNMYIFYFDKIAAKPSLSEICDEINLIIPTIPT